jgi:O-antigen/teichoic acid export membrane protein
MAVMSVLRLVSQVVLTYMCLPEHFGVVALMRTFLTFVEMVSDMGIRNAVVSHPRGEDRSFLGTAASVQLLRGIGMWAVTCAVAWPAATFYDAPLLLWLLPIAGFEAVNNGLYAVRAYVEERNMRLGLPTMLDVLALCVSILTSVVWASIEPSSWALALGPLVGGSVRMLASHALFRGERVPFAWNRAYAGELFAYSRWIIGSTTVSFVAQQFHLLYLAKFLSKGALGVYGVAWNLCAQSSKPMTALANRVIIPHLAEARRSSPQELERTLARSLASFLPACMLACLGAGLFAPAMFGLLYDDSFAAGGWMARLFAIDVWFMILQQVPRSTLLSLGLSRGVATMALWNAVTAVIGIVAGFALTRGSIGGAIVGNALGHLAGCAIGCFALRAHGLRVVPAMGRASLVFLALLGAGTLLARELVDLDVLGRSAASVAATCAIATPVALVVWRTSIAPLRARSRGGAA